VRIAKLYLIIFFLILPTANFVQGQKQNVNVMEKLVNGFNEYKDTITEWNITIKEQMSQKDILKRVEKLKKEYNVVKTSGDGSQKFHVSDSDQITNGNVRFTAIIPDELRFKAEFIMSINGHNWNESTEQTSMKQVDRLKEHYFTNESKTFTCLTADIHDTINSVYFMDKVKESYQAKILSKQMDSNDKSMIKEIKYGYTPLWREKIIIDGNPINLQFVIKKTTDDAIEIRVGTPILINEY